MELFAKIFVITLILGIAATSCYCVYDINRIRAKWKKEGVNEHELRAEFYRAINNDDDV